MDKPRQQLGGPRQQLGGPRQRDHYLFHRAASWSKRQRHSDNTRRDSDAEIAMASAHCPCHVSSSSSPSPSPSPSPSSALFSGPLRASLRPPTSVRFVGIQSGFRAGFGMKKNRKGVVTCAVGDVSSDSTTYLIAGAVAITLIGTAYPLLFSRKDLCPECDGAGFIRKTGSALRANAARKDSLQIVCPTCSGLGKIGQVDK